MSHRDAFLDSCSRPTRRNVISALGGFGLLAACPLQKAAAQSKVVIQNGESAPIPIAIPSFVPGRPDDGDVAAGMSEIITDNLTRSGLFAPIDRSAFIERAPDIDTAPQFQSWRTLHAQGLVVGRAR